MTTKERILEKVEESFKRAESFYGKTFSRPDFFEWKRNGTTAGYCLHSPTKKYLMFQLDLAEQNMDDFINQVVPHEVAHYIQFEHYGYRNNKAHGRYWKYVMEAVMRIPAIRCHAYDTEQTKTCQFKKVVYVCNCKEHPVTLRLHNKMQRTLKILGHTNYTCRSCKAHIRLKSNEVIAPNPLEQKIKALQAELAKMQDNAKV